LVSTFTEVISQKQQQQQVKCAKITLKETLEVNPVKDIPKKIQKNALTGKKGEDECFTMSSKKKIHNKLFCFGTFMTHGFKQF